MEYWSKAKPYLFRNGLYPHCFRLVGAPNFDRIFSNIKNDMENAGATWTDEPAFRDGNLVWGRMVADIPDYYRELIKALSA